MLTKAWGVGNAQRGAAPLATPMGNRGPVLVAVRASTVQVGVLRRAEYR
jgi:hypothetical protein